MDYNRLSMGHILILVIDSGGGGEKRGGEGGGRGGAVGHIFMGNCLSSSVCGEKGHFYNSISTFI